MNIQDMIKVRENCQQKIRAAVDEYLKVFRPEGMNEDDLDQLCEDVWFALLLKPTDEACQEALQNVC